MKVKHREPGTLRAVHYAIGVIIILVVSGFICAFLPLESDKEVGTWIWLNVVLLGALGSKIRGIYKFNFKRAQIHRDELALDVAKKKRQDFFLYLRPFNSTGKMPITVRRISGYNRDKFSLPAGFEVDETDLETELARALEPCAPLSRNSQSEGNHSRAGVRDTLHPPPHDWTRAKETSYCRSLVSTPKISGRRGGLAQHAVARRVLLTVD
jgi:hypothetical protein